MSFLTRTYPFKQSKHLLKDSSIFGFIIYLLYQGVPKQLCWCTGMLAISRHFVYYRAVKIKQSSE